MYAFPADNILNTATLTMTATLPSSAIERVDEDAKAGGGDVRVIGPYTGDADALIEIKIDDEVIEGPPSVSQPQFTGVGNASITTPTAAEGMVAETFVLTVENLGTETRFAEAEFQGATLRATVSGPFSGRIEITPDLVLTDTEYSVRETIAQDAEILDGQHFNWGARALTADGDMPASAPRLRVGIEPTVFRQYSKWDRERGRYVYGLSPRPPRPIPAGALVRSVTGTYTMQIIAGEAVETYPGLVTLYDALDAMRSRSALIKPTTAVVADHSPGGMAAVDLSVLTTSYCAAITADGSEGVQRGDILLVVGPNAPTEILSIEFVDSSTAEVRGEISGLIGRAGVGEQFTSEHYSFRVPRPPTDPQATGAQTILILRLASRDGGSVPALCSYQTRPGINLRNGATKWVWATNPAPPCPCTDLSADNAPPSDDCLGIETEDTAVSNESILLRLQRLATWVSDFTTNNTYLFDGYEVDIGIATRGASMLQSSLIAIAGGTLDNPKWVASKVYKRDQVVEPITDNGYRYAIVNGGTAHTSEPTFSTTIGADATDGASVVYRNIGKKPLGMWDDAFEQLKLDVIAIYPTQTTFPGLGATIWYPAAEWGTADNAGAMLLPTTDNGHYYLFKSGVGPGTLGTTEPTWTTDGSDVTVGDFVFFDAGLYGGLQRSTAYAVDAVVYSVYHGLLLCVASTGTTSATMPGYADIPLNSTFVDGDVTWKLLSRNQAGSGSASAPTEAFWSRYTAMGNNLRAAAGITPNFPESSGTERCWTAVKDSPGAFFDAGSEEPRYMPVWANHWNVMAKEGPDGVYSTQEGAFLPLISCAESLATGDELIRVVTGVTGTGSGWYQQGDSWRCEINNAGPVELGGGQTGNDITTISVVGTSSGRLRDYLLYRPSPAAYSGGADAWESEAAYVAGDYVRPTTANGLRYRALSDGDAGTSEPTWPTDIDDEVIDGDITWVCVGPDAVLGFTVTEGGIRLALGDSWTFRIEGGHIVWRINGGAWSDPEPIAPTVALTAGLSAVFAGGAPPSWVTDDTWTWRALALSGVGNLRRPTGRMTRWTGPMVLNVVPDDGTADRLVILEHEIPDDATITLQGSDDAFSTTPLNVVVPWQAGSIHYPITTPRARYRLLVSAAGGAYWVFIGTLRTPKIRTGANERGTWEPEDFLPTPARRGGIGGRMTHTWLSKAEAQALRAGLAAASTTDQGRFAFIPNTSEPEAHLVAIAAGSTLRIVDEFGGYAPRDPTYRRLSLQIEMEPAL